MSPVGNYNPRSPIILGEEWVDIRDEDVLFSPAFNTYELGTEFELASPRQFAEARFYINQSPPSFGQVFFANVYPAGMEDDQGPIRRVVIPCNAGAITGASIGLSAGSTVADAVLNPADGKVVSFTDLGPATLNTVSFFFAVNQYPILTGKRILACNILYVADGTMNDGTVDEIVLGPGVRDNAFNIATMSPETFLGDGTMRRLELGEVAWFWDTNNPQNTSTRVPITYSTLQQFEISSANRVFFTIAHFPSGTAPAATFLLYLAMEVVFCDETRVAFGGRQYGSGISTSTIMASYIDNTNSMPMYSPSLVANPVLAAGRYIGTLYSPSTGEFVVGGGFSNTVDNFLYPDINGLRQLYEIPSHPAKKINIPFPSWEHIDEQLTVATSMILPQLSFHATGGTLTEPHVYGRQAAAHVYGSITATQDINDDISGVNAVYPQVRYYARRYGDTTIPLTLTGVGGLSGSTASIAVADFDALSEIIDGWKEVTLRFAAPPTMGTVAGFPAWTWSATGELAGNRWEIMAACAPAVSGIPTNLFNQIEPATQRLGVATYEPLSGDTVELTWMPQGVASPYVTGVSADPACDAVLLFSQDPPTVTGVMLTAQSQTVTGIGLDCGSLPCCIPSGIAYTQLTWGATSLPATGFGAYEIQRWDNLQDDFETIALATNLNLISFNDYEARVGISSVYRIRALNALNFAGAWSTYVTGAPPTPGVTGGCEDQTGALIFTSNAAQSGIYNAAYAMQWEGTPNESFELPEAGAVQLQPIYGRDGSIAFHGTERGLEAFSRVVLLQAAAIDPIRLADAKTIRDLAWAALPYVCVRDDIGDRWFANVRVPNISVRNNRRSYLARIDITETTPCPYPVNP